MVTLLSKALQLRNYFSTDEETTVQEILLSSVHVSSLMFNLRSSAEIIRTAI